MKRPTSIRARGRKLLPSDRRGAVSVEFAIVAPCFLAIMLGVTETSRLLETHTLLATAVREGARLAATDRDGIVPEGASTNDKIERDIQNFLSAAGLATEDLDIKIVDHEDPSVTFDLDNPANNLKLFEIQVSMPWSVSVKGVDSFSVTSKIVFRNARASLLE